jgi:hypothetical protein
MEKLNNILLIGLYFNSNQELLILKIENKLNQSEIFNILINYLNANF